MRTVPCPPRRGAPAFRSRGAGRRALRLTGWNALFAIAALVFVAVAGEAWFRLTMPFWSSETPMRFHPKAGLLGLPDAEVRWTNLLDFWTVSRTNGLGFLDREPPNPERAAASCHIAAIGDSFVEAKQVPIANKFHVRLEEMAARELPRLDVTTSAFGFRNTGQANQLPYYDEFARRLSPEVLVLVFVSNDFADNSPVLKAVWWGGDPDHLPHVTARRGPDGTIALHPPDPDWRERALPLSLPARIMDGAGDMFVLGNFLKRELKPRVRFPGSYPSRRRMRAELLSRRPGNERLLDDWRSATGERMLSPFRREELPPFFEASLEFTAFALDRFAERARRDGAALLVLATHTMRGRGHPLFERLAAMAEARNIPVIDQVDAIRRSDSEIGDAHWAHDSHWNPAGHRWAAEALLDYLKRHPRLCDDAAGPEGP